MSKRRVHQIEIIFLDVQKSQQQLHTTELELTNYQLDYQLLKEEFSLFKEGYIIGLDEYMRC